jgi:sarcosine oxidase subunit delta
MLLLPCPWCGARDEIEFHYGGEAHIVYPTDPGTVDAATWSAFLYVRDNPSGLVRERWSHASGCRRWFNVVRDTRTHEIVASYLPFEPVPLVDPSRSG